MNLAEVWTAATEAWGLLATYPLHWLAVVVVFLIAVECLMFIPFVGFVLKLAVAGVAAAQVIALFGAAAAGESPNPLALFAAFSLPIGAQVALAFAALLPFAVGIGYLYVKAGPKGIEFFFGNIFKLKPPAAELFVKFKYVMQVAALPFTFLAGAVVIKGLSGIAAISTAVVAAATHWLPVLVLGALAFALEWSSVQLASLLPKPAAVVVGVVLLVAFLAWSFAFTYTVSARVFGPAVVRSAV